jgi:hypothetical protein
MKRNPTQRKTHKAIDILSEPDATMIKQAEAANAGLFRNFPTARPSTNLPTSERL